MMSILSKLVLVLIASFLFFSCIKEGNDEMTFSYIDVSSQIPSFVVEDTIGNTFSSKQFLGKHSLLVFFGTYCSDCKNVLPVIEEVWRKMKNDPAFLLVTISREETAEEVAGYWKENRFTMPFYLDPTHGSVYALFANKIIPRIYLINPDNEVVWMAVESLDISAEELIQKLKELK